MNTNIDDFRLRLVTASPAKPLTLKEFLDERIAFLKLLGSLHPLFRDGLHLIGNSRKNSPELAPDLSNVEQFMFDKVAENYRKSDPRWFTNMTSDGRATHSTTTELQFRLSLGNLRSTEKDHIHIDLDGGSTDPQAGSGIGIELPYAGETEFSDPAFLRELLDVVVSYWKPPGASISSRALSNVTRHQDKDTPYANPIGWFTYLDDARAASALPPDVHRERFGDGVLFTLEPDSPLKDFEAAAQKARRIRDALLPGQWMVLRRDRVVPTQTPKAA